MNNGTLDDILGKLFIKQGEKSTHTRIGNSQLNIRGGAYNIDYSKTAVTNIFFKRYFKKVFKRKNDEYLTELQDKINGGPILIDLDFKLEKNTKDRIFDDEIISDIIETYVENIVKYFDLGEIKSFDLFVLLKDEMVEEAEYIKEGIHIQINLILKHDKQLFLREKIMNIVNDEIFTSSGFVFKNTIDDIFDSSISSGNTGWLMYGSKKPGCEPYKLKHHYQVILDGGDYEVIEKKKIDETDSSLLKSLIKTLSIRNTTHNEIFIKKEYEHEITKKAKTTNTIIIKESHIGKDWIINSFQNIASEESCDKMIEIILSNESNSLSNISEINNYVMCCLDDKYYKPFAQWIRVLWAMKNINTLLYPFFLKWSSQSDEFCWSADYVDGIYKNWCETKHSGLTEGSVRFWARESNPIAYQEIRNNSTKYYIEKTLEGKGTDHDIATLIHHLLFDKYRCTSIKGNRWYCFINHKWSSSESGTGLRRKFSSEISPLYIQKQTEIMEQIREDDNMTHDTQDRLTT